MGYGVLCTSVLSLLTPVAVRTNVYLFIALRVLEGIGEGVTFPAMYAMWGQWAPVLERSYLMTFCFSGATFGTVLALPLSGQMISSDVMGGWPSVFYVFGSIGCVWCVIWLATTHDSPACHPRISTAEREHIQASIGDTTYYPPPWRDILLSPAVWAIVTAHFTASWGFCILLTSLPSYLADILKLDMKQNGNLSALPYAFAFIVALATGVLADLTRSRGILSTRNVRKVCTCLGQLLPAVFIVLVGYVGCEWEWAVTFLTLSNGSMALSNGGYAVNHVDLSPRFAGILIGITNAAAAIPGFAAPAMVGYLTDNNNTLPQWQIVFYISASVYAFGSLLYAVFAKGEEQPWSKNYVIK